MDFPDVTRLALIEYRESLGHTFDGLTAEQLRWQPSAAANHILWLAWPIARTEDAWLNRYAGNGSSVWRLPRWNTLGGDLSWSGGAGHTAEEVANFPDIPLAEITAYHEAVRSQSLKVLDALTVADLDTRNMGLAPDFGDPPPTIVWTLAHVVVETAQHAGQAAYTRGLMADMAK